MPFVTSGTKNLRLSNRSLSFKKGESKYKMLMAPNKIIIFALLNILVLAKEEPNEQGRHFQAYYPSEGDKNQIFQFPSGNYPFKDDYVECLKNPLLPLLGKGMNLILLKLGMFGIMKAITAMVLLAFLVKFPLLLLKIAFVKSFFLPVLAAPLLIHLFTNHMMQASGSENEKPTMQAETPEVMGMNDMNPGMGRQLTNNLTSFGWRSLRMFVESDQCAEKISCIIGASYRDSSMISVFSRMLKYLQYSSPPLLQKRMSLIRDAFNRGNKTSTCLEEDYKCQSPSLLIQQGSEQIRIL